MSNCCRCGRKLSEVGVSFPIEPKGTPNRKWDCASCMSEKELGGVNKDVKKVTSDINEALNGTNKKGE